MEALLISIIIPCKKQDNNLKLLLNDIASQQISGEQEAIIMEGIYPPGEARNQGAKKAKGNVLVFTDGDIRLGNNDLIMRLAEVILSDSQVGIAIASIRIPPDANSFQRRYAREIPLCQIPIVEKTTEIGTAPSACFAIRKELFENIGGFRQEMIRGEDSEFSLRLTKRGYRIVIAPYAFYYHRQPDNLSTLIKTQIRNAIGVAYADSFYPLLNIDIEPYNLNYACERRNFLSRIKRFASSWLQALAGGKTLLLFSKCIYSVTYGFTLFKYRLARCKR